jgi:hypothetical protein
MKFNSYNPIMVSTFNKCSLILARETSGHTAHVFRRWEHQRHHKHTFDACLDELTHVWWNTYWSVMPIEMWPTQRHNVITYGTFEHTMAWKVYQCMENKYIVIYCTSLRGLSKSIIMCKNTFELYNHHVWILQAYCILENNTYLDGADVIASDDNTELDHQKQVWLHALANCLWPNDECNQDSIICLHAMYDHVTNIKGGSALCQRLGDL